MLFVRISRKRNLRKVCAFMSTSVAGNLDKTENLINIRPILDTRLKLRAREPFLKNLFLGKLDTKFFELPVVEGYDRYKEFTKWSQSIENCITSYYDEKGASGNVSNNLLNLLKGHFLFEGRVDRQYNGIGVSSSEMCQLLETVSCTADLRTYLIQNNVIPIDLINKYCTESQKQKYLPQIASRELIPTLCIAEAESGTNVKSIKAKAVLSDCGTFYTLNGKKTFVTNGTDSNLFLVFALCSNNENNDDKRKMISVFLVERDFGGINIETEYKTIGGAGIRLCTVSFKNTLIPKENRADHGTGIDVLLDVFSPGSHNTAASAVAVLRNFIGACTKEILHRKRYDKYMYEHDFVQKVIGQMACDLYGMESVLYMTTLIEDAYENQDLSLERAVTETHCVETCVKNIYSGLHLIGLHSYLEKNPYIKMYEDALSLTLFDTYGGDSHSYIALLGLQHAGHEIHEHIRKMRNPLDNPIYVFKFRQQGLKDVLTRDFKKEPETCIHPSLETAVSLLHECVGTLHYCVVNLLEYYGAEVLPCHIELHRISEMVIGTYVLAAALARSSRSYSIGLRNSNLELDIAFTLGQTISDRVSWLAEQIKNGPLRSGDVMCKNVGKAVFQNKGYCMEHPLKKAYT